MRVITCRSIEKSGTGLEKFGKTPSAEGSSSESRPPVFDDITPCQTDTKNADGADTLENISRNLTDASWVQESHSPFGELKGKNNKFSACFREAFTGEPAEEPLRFRAERNWYEIPR